MDRHNCMEEVPRAANLLKASLLGIAMQRIRISLAVLGRRPSTIEATQYRLEVMTLVVSTLVATAMDPSMATLRQPAFDQPYPLLAA